MKTKVYSLAVFLVAVILAVGGFSGDALAQYTNPHKVTFEVVILPEWVMTESTPPGFEICLVNRNDVDTELINDGADNMDQIIIGIPFGTDDEQLTDDVSNCTCTAMEPGWECLGPDASDGMNAYLTLLPTGTTTVEAYSTVCFLLDGVPINAAEGLVQVSIDQQINPVRAKKPVNVVERIFKTYIGLDADTVDGIHGTDLADAIAAIEDLLQHFSRNGDNVYIDGANLHIRNGQGTTNSTNSLGNLFLGYHGATGSGSHNYVTGQNNNYSSYAGIVAGANNQITAPYATVTGGYYNRATANYAQVSGGRYNTASGQYSSVNGGYYNTATYYYASVNGGYRGRATGYYSSVNGGYGGYASYYYTTVNGGYYNTASYYYAAAHGGYQSKATGYMSSALGGYYNSASGYYSCVSGGRYSRATYYYTSVQGGYYNTASGWYASVSGGRYCRATDYYTSVLGGYYNTAGQDYATVSGGRYCRATGAYSSVSGGSSRSVGGSYDWRGGMYFSGS
jgi:hypothetical protein